MTALTRYMDEDHRPQYHYTAEKNMINDPNGLFFLDGTYHLCHQYNQHETVHWGHAVSTDLVHWQHLSPAIHEDELGQIYSGTAVIDTADSGRWGGSSSTRPVVAFFTYASHPAGEQSQAIAVSRDGGRTFIKPDANIVLPNPGRKDFRDPKVFWHGPSAAWVLVVTGGDHLLFYRSFDLHSWRFASTWGHDQGAHGGVWECPDLFELPLEGTDERRWVVSVSVDKGSPAGGSGMQYFVGHFDGTTFVNGNPPDLTLWHNFGQDYYAGITWTDAPADRRLMIAWTDNWLYRFDVPTTPFNGQLSLVHELHLIGGHHGPRLAHRPAAELTTLRGNPWTQGGLVVPADTDCSLEDVVGECLEVVAEWDLAGTTATTFGLDVRVGPGQHARIGVDRVAREVFVDRTHAGPAPHPAWTGRHAAPVDLDGPTLIVRAFVDRSSLEVFIDDQVMISDLILPARHSQGVALHARGGDAVLRSLTVFPLARIWADEPPGAPGHDHDWDIVSGDFARTRAGLQGSAAGLGVALWPTRPQQGGEPASGSAAIAVDITILGSTEGSPRTVLGEECAGLVLGYDADTGSGFLVALDRGAGAVRLETLGEGGHRTALHTVPFQLQSNCTYRLTTRGDSRRVTIDLAGTPLFQAPIEGSGDLRSGVFVKNAEAVFVDRR